MCLHNCIRPHGNLNRGAFDVAAFGLRSMGSGNNGHAIRKTWEPE